MEILSGHNGMYHLLVTLPACAFWAIGIYCIWMRFEGNELIWTKKDGWKR